MVFFLYFAILHYSDQPCEHAAPHLQAPGGGLAEQRPVQLDDEEATPVVEHHLAGDLHLGGRHSGVGTAAHHAHAAVQGMERPSAASGVSSAQAGV